MARTLSAEALLVVAVLLVVGRLIGQEPAREVLASQHPPQLVIPLAFATDDGTRQGQLAIAPGAAGVNTFTLEVDGAPLPEGSEGVLRFALPAQDMGEQELTLPQEGPNHFTAEGPELALAGDWRLEVLVRKIGAFSWETQHPVAHRRRRHRRLPTQPRTTVWSRRDRGHGRRWRSGWRGWRPRP